MKNMKRKPSSYRAYSSWQCMRIRCFNRNRNTWNNYGGRGISVCERWSSFWNFLQDMGERPSGYSIDRIDPNRNYKKSNCRWVSKGEQARTTRKYLQMKDCFVCGKGRGNRKGRCGNCSAYFLRNGFERPKFEKMCDYRRYILRNVKCPKCMGPIVHRNMLPAKGTCSRCWHTAWTRKKYGHKKREAN